MRVCYTGLFQCLATGSVEFGLSYNDLRYDNIRALACMKSWAEHSRRRSNPLPSLQHQESQGLLLHAIEEEHKTDICSQYVYLQYDKH